MKKLNISIFILSLLLSACNVPQKLLNQRQYDEAIKKTVPKIKKSQKDKHINVLAEAYRLANMENNSRISFLRAEGRPENWEEVFRLYSRMANRQHLVRSLNEDVLLRIGFVYIDYDKEIIQSKQKAAEFLYAQSEQLIASGDKLSARRAWENLQKVKSWYPTFKDIDTKINEARQAGMNYVIFEMRNATPIPLPPDFESELTKISLNELNQKWILYDVKRVTARKYDYQILVNMKVIDVSPEGVKEIHYTEEKEVPDGFDYVLDAKGNVMKDSLGNDIKIPKHKKNVCRVVETQLHKASTIRGSVDFVDLSSGQLIKTEPIFAENFFNYSWAVASGDLSAMTEATGKKLKNRPAGFPPDFEMLLQNAQVIKGMTKDIIWRHKSLFLR